LVALIGVMAYNQSVFGNPLRIYDWRELLLGPSLIGPMIVRLAGLFYDNAFGLFVAAPIWAIIIPGAIMFWRRQRNQALNLCLLAGPYILLVTSRTEWYAGWSPPFRYLVALLPFFALLAGVTFTVRKGTGARLLLAPLALSSALAGALWTAMPGWTYNFAHGTSYWVDQWTRLSGVDWMRFLPSAVRPSAPAVVAPILLTILIGLIWFGLGGAANVWRSSLLGVGVALLVVVFVTAVVRRLPTTHIEAESAIAIKTGGHPEPRRWTNNRTRFREGWTLRHGERLTVPVQPAGRRLQLQLALRLFRNRNEDLIMSVFADQRKIGGLRLHRSDQWLLETIGPIDWSGAESLSLEVGPPLTTGLEGVVNGVAIDFLDFSWD